VFRTVDDMKRDGTPITFAAVARTAKVSTWLVYADGVRDYIVAAQEQQAAEPARSRITGRLASDASLRTDLELARQDNRNLREEVTRLKTILRERLGQHLETESTETLRRHIDEITEANTRYQTEKAALTRRVEQLTDQLQATEDELSAARTSLRRMIKSQTADLATSTGD
jgi:chromosome segregation ATPase